MTKRFTVCGVVLALALLSACTDWLVAPDRPVNNTLIFDELWSSADRHYSYFHAKGINWDSLRSTYRPRAIEATSERELASVLSSMLAELRDPHVALTPFGAGSTSRYLTPGDTTPTFFSAKSVLQPFVSAKSTAKVASKDPRVQSAIVAPDVGYLALANFSGVNWDAEFDGALDSLSDTRCLILDVRDNSGGTYAMAVSLAGRFASAQRPFGYLRFRNGARHDAFTDLIPEVVKPSGARAYRGCVILLTNRRTVSSAEVFVLAMRTSERVTVVGDTTAGASGGPTARELSNGWIYELSEWMEYTLDGKSYEGRGLAPDVVVPFKSVHASQRIDPVFEYARALAIRTVTSPQ